MTRLDYENLCRAVSQGEEKLLKNNDSRVVGKVLSCHLDHFNVQVEEGWQVWKRDICAELEAEAAKTDFQI